MLYNFFPQRTKAQGENIDGILICGVVLAAVMVIRSQSQEAETGVFAAVRNDPNDDGAADAFTASSSVSLFEHSSLSSDDDWPTSSATDVNFVTSGYEPDSGMDTSRWTDPMYAHEPDNIYHGTMIAPTHHDDDWSGSTSSFDDSFSSSSSFDD